MRLFILSALVLLLCGCPNTPVTPPVPPTPGDWLVSINLSYDFSNFVPCSATVTKGCISGFQWGYMSGTSQVPLKTSPVTICAGSTQPEACTDTTNATVGIGAVVPYAIANGFDNSGSPVSSAAATGPSTNVAIGMPVVLSVSFK